MLASKLLVARSNAAVFSKLHALVQAQQRGFCAPTRVYFVDNVLPGRVTGLLIADAWPDANICTSASQEDRSTRTS